MSNSIGGNGGPAGFRPIDIDGAVESGTITDREARELRRIDKSGDGTIDKSEANLDDGNTADDTLDLENVDLGRRNLFNKPEARRQALAGAFFATQDGPLRETAAAVLTKRVRDDARTSRRDDSLDATRLGQAVDTRSLAQVTAMCKVAAEEWDGADADSRAALANEVGTTLFGSSTQQPVDARQRQIWRAALAKLPPELAGAIMKDAASTLTTAIDVGTSRTVDAGLHDAVAVARNLSAALEESPPLRAGGLDGPTLQSVVGTTVDELLDAGQADVAAQLISNTAVALPAGERTRIFERLCASVATSETHSDCLDRLPALRADMYETLAPQFHALPSSQQALFAREIFADMRATGAAVLKDQIETHLARVDQQMAATQEAWSAAAAVIADPAADEEAKLAAIAAFCEAARATPEDELYEAMFTPPATTVLYPEPEWVGLLAHQALNATSPEDHRAVLDSIEARFTDFDGSFHTEGFTRVFAEPLAASLANPERLEVHRTLARYAEHPEKLDPFDLDNVRQTILAEHGVCPERGASDDPLQAAVNRVHRQWKAGEVAKDVSLVALQVGAVVGANAVAPILGSAVTAGLFTADFIGTVQTINLAHALNDAGSMTPEEKKAEELAAVVGLGLSIASCAGSGRLTKGATRMAMRLLKRGVPKGKLMRLVHRLARDSGMTERVAREFADNLGKELGSDAIEERVRGD